MLTSEIKYYFKNGGDDKFGHHKGDDYRQIKGNHISLSISCVIFAVLLLLLLATFISWKKNKDTIKIDESCKTRELYSAICKAPRNCIYKMKSENRDEKEGVDEFQNSQNVSVVPIKIRVARLYHLLFLIRRLVVILIIVIIPSHSLFALKISLLLILQILCIVYAALIRSFSNKKNQVVEVFNETIVFVLIIFLANFNSEEKWKEPVVHTFIGIILFQAYTLLLVTIIGAIVKLFRFIQRCRTRVRIKNFEEDQNEENHQEDQKEAKSSSSISNDFNQGRMVGCTRNHNTFDPSHNTTFEFFKEDLKQGADLQTRTLY